MKKRETSKTILGSVLIFCGSSFVAGLVGWFLKLEDAAVILGIIAGIGVLVVRYYMRKAQAENLLKIQKSTGKTDAQMEKLVDLAERGTKQESE
jgi:hypothetical protein